MTIRLFRTEGFRIAAIFVAMFALATAVLASSVLFIVDDEFHNQILQFARADIAAIRDGYRTEGVPEAEEVISQRMASPGASDFFLLQEDGVRLAGNLAPMTPLPGAQTLPYPGKDARHAILGLGTFIAPGLYVYSGSDLYHARLARERILLALGWVLAGALVMAALGGILVGRSLLRRTDAIARACGAIMAGDLKMRIPVRGTGDELDRLSDRINEMLDRIAALMENLRQVTNDIAHDLRTPVTHLRHRLERARHEARSMADYDEAVAAATAAADAILGQFAALLRIAQIEGGARRAGFAPQDLAELLAHMRDLYGPVAEDSGHHLNIGAMPTAIIQGDRELLVQLFANLIENGIVHTPPGTTITIALTVAADSAMVTVSDDGPGVPASEHEKLFRRLYRYEASRSKPGYGLGLAVVAAIAELHGAQIATDRDRNKGFAMILSFPHNR